MGMYTTLMVGHKLQARASRGNYPFFFTKIIDVYLKGNIITGWGGKFSNHNQQIKEIAPISPEEGILTVW